MYGNNLKICLIILTSKTYNLINIPQNYDILDYLNFEVFLGYIY